MQCVLNFAEMKTEFQHLILDAQNTTAQNLYDNERCIRQIIKEYRGKLVTACEDDFTSHDTRVLSRTAKEMTLNKIL